MPKFPNITVPLAGEDGNAFMIVGRVRRALRDGGVTEPALSEFTTEAMSGDYDHVIQTVMATVNVT